MQELEVKLREKHIKDAQFEQTERRGVRTRTEDRISILEETATGKRKELEKIIADTEKEEKKLKKEKPAEAAGCVIEGGGGALQVMRTGQPDQTITKIFALQQHEDQKHDDHGSRRQGRKRLRQAREDGAVHPDGEVIDFKG